VLDANWDAVTLFPRLATQWNYRHHWTVVPAGLGGVAVSTEIRSGLKYPSVWGFIDRMPDGTDRDRVFWGIQVMEAAIIEYDNDQLQAGHDQRHRR